MGCIKIMSKKTYRTGHKRSRNGYSVIQQKNVPNVPVNQQYVYTEKMETLGEQEFEEIINVYLEEMVTELNLRLLMDMSVKACMNEELLLVENIVLTKINYPDVSNRENVSEA